MEDIQDGIKKSIQDGVEEDPELEEHFVTTGKSGLQLKYMVTEIMNPKIESVVEVSTDSEDLTASIATLIELAVA